MSDTKPADDQLRTLYEEIREKQGQLNELLRARGPEDLKGTAIFVGGSNVAAGEAILEAVTKCFFGPMRVSVMMDSNGSNTTAAAAVLAAARHVNLANATVLVLAATGPVGQRVTRLLARQGTTVRAASRSVERAQGACDAVASVVEGAQLTAHEKIA